MGLDAILAAGEQSRQPPNVAVHCLWIKAWRAPSSANWRNIPFTLINQRAYSPLRSPIGMLSRVVPVVVFAGFERSLHEAHQLFGWGRIGNSRGAVRVGEPDVERTGQFEKRHHSAANRAEGRAGMGSDPGAAHPAAGRREREAYAIG
jgi:hypothetical protein